MAEKVRDSISRVRGVVKAVKEDPFMTDRFIYSLITKHAAALIEQDSKMESIFKEVTLFKEIPCLELIEVDRIEACCTSIRTGCTFRRSKEKLPAIREYNNGPIIRAITSIDYSVRAHRSSPVEYTNMTKTSGFKYNKEKYYWILDDYLFLPNVQWEGVRVQAMFEDSLSHLLCNVDEDNADCTIAQERSLSIPHHLFSSIEQLVITEILTAGQIPSDGPDDSQNVLR